MISCGMRVGSWAYLKWGDITPIIENEVVIAAKIEIFNTKTNKHYFSFITPEAYEAVKEWMEFRESFGEKITDDSWVMRNLWQIKSQRYGNYLGLAKHPVQFSVDGIRMLINNAWKIQGVRDKPTNGTRYSFKSLHGFRKFFETACQKSMKSINVSILMSHDTGLTQHYYKPKEEELLEDYVKAIPSLTIELDKRQLGRQIKELQEKNKNSDWIIREKLQEKDEEIKRITEDAKNKDDILGKLLQKVESLENDVKQERKRWMKFISS